MIDEKWNALSIPRAKGEMIVTDTQTGRFETPEVKHFTKTEAKNFFGEGKVKVERTYQRDVMRINGVLCSIEGVKSQPLRAIKDKNSVSMLTPSAERNRRRNERKKLRKK